MSGVLKDSECENSLSLFFIAIDILGTTFSSFFFMSASEVSMKRCVYSSKFEIHCEAKNTKRSELGKN